MFLFYFRNVAELYGLPNDRVKYLEAFYPLPFPPSPKTELPHSIPTTTIPQSSFLLPHHLLRQLTKLTCSFKKEKAYETPCDYFDGKWIRDRRGLLNNSTTCGTIKEGQNCITCGRPDSGYLYWRWKPSQCSLPRFEPQTFLQLISNKNVAFVGDSMPGNQLESLLCMISTGSTPNLVYRNGDDNITGGSVLGCHYCLGLNHTEIGFYDVLRKALRTTLNSIIDRRRGKGYGIDVIVTTFSPAHFEGEWDKASVCSKTKPYRNGEKKLEGMDADMRNIEIEEVEDAKTKANNFGGIIRLRHWM
ncbi:hypothetical protein JHK86_010279 [Glycine max]|uniref:Uncharacterized protein n=1 Tax=Glycine max TaxID=3847 RepID=I1JWA5_SOYBN|nr:hypothetical protein JHK86_010279 [Glycine max]